MNVPELLESIATRIRGVSGVAGAYYPAPDQIQLFPSVVLYWTGNSDTTITHNTGQQLWLPMVKAQVLGRQVGNGTPAEFAIVDGLLTRIVDAFAVDPNGGGISTVLPDLDGSVDRVLVTAIRPTLQISYAGHVHYGAELFFDIKFRRVPEYMP